MSLTDRAIHASKWSALAEISAKGIPSLIFTILAILLTPEDFGVVAIATMVINFAQLFWEAGLKKRSSNETPICRLQSNVVFWTNIALEPLFIVCSFFRSAAFFPFS